MGEIHDFAVWHGAAARFDMSDDLSADIATDELKPGRKIVLRPPFLIAQPRYVMAYDIFVPVHPHLQASLLIHHGLEGKWPKRFDTLSRLFPYFRR
jgi:hypothetical protein